MRKIIILIFIFYANVSFSQELIKTNHNDLKGEGISYTYSNNLNINCNECVYNVLIEYLDYCNSDSVNHVGVELERFRHIEQAKISLKKHKSDFPEYEFCIDTICVLDKYYRVLNVITYYEHKDPTFEGFMEWLKENNQ